MRFRDISPEMLTLPELEEEFTYMTKRLYRLRKLQGMGKTVEPSLSEVDAREASLDMELRKRRMRMEEIPS